ncbi:MAG: fructosamine kinase family protein [Pseudomonadota bacterium]
MWPQICEHISTATYSPFELRTRLPAAGGCINSAHIIEDGHGRKYFIKLNDAILATMFEAEAAGLREIAQTNTLLTPEPVCHGTVGDTAYLVLTYLDLRGRNDNATQERLGQQLAAMHRVTAPCHGWRIDNTIGSTPQINIPNHDWLTFWREHRLGLQFELAARNGYHGTLQHKGERLLAAMNTFFAGHTPAPSLLHGDLWSGNYGVDTNGNPVIFDPAIYYGDRETDLAMTELFGGFTARFYQAYNEAWPLDSGHLVRKNLYNLYHVLNHLNLFGGSYLSQAMGMIDTLLAEK